RIQGCGHVYRRCAVPPGEPPPPASHILPCFQTRDAPFSRANFLPRETTRGPPEFGDDSARKFPVFYDRAPRIAPLCRSPERVDAFRLFRKAPDRPSVLEKSPTCGVSSWW